MLNACVWVIIRAFYMPHKNAGKHHANYTGGLTKRMDEKKLDHFRNILLEQLRRRTESVRENQADALEMAAADDGVKDVADMSLQDVSQEIEYRLSERESQMVADIDQALLRIDEGSYGVCARCGQDIPEARLDAVPTARYDAPCQSLIEQGTGEDEHATL